MMQVKSTLPILGVPLDPYKVLKYVSGRIKFDLRKMYKHAANRLAAFHALVFSDLYSDIQISESCEPIILHQY